MVLEALCNFSCSGISNAAFAPILQQARVPQSHQHLLCGTFSTVQEPSRKRCNALRHRDLGAEQCIKPIQRKRIHSATSASASSFHGQRIFGARIPCSNLSKWSMDASAAFPAFVELNRGTWAGTFYQFDAFGKVLEKIETSVDVSSDGAAEDLTMHQRLRIRESDPEAASTSQSDPVFDLSSSRTSLGDAQQLSYFPGDGAFSMSHQTAEALDALLRRGVSQSEGEEADRTVRFPSDRPALVSECCLHSEAGDRRVRAIHVVDTRGLLDQIGVFVEGKKEGEQLDTHDDPRTRINAWLGEWTGHALSRRTALYGGTVTEYASSISLKKGPDGTLEQVLKMGSGGFELKATASLDGSVIVYPGGLQTTLLPGGIAVTCPLNVKPGQSFYFEMSWIESPGHRSRMIRTYDLDGLVVSTTLVKEVLSRE